MYLDRASDTLCFLTMLVLCFLAYDALAMESAEPLAKRRKTEDVLVTSANASFENLPDELLVKIIRFLTYTGKNGIDSASQSIKNVAQLSNRFYGLVNDSRMTNKLISCLRKIYQVTDLTAALKLHTFGAREWLRTHPEVTSTLEEPYPMITLEREEKKKHIKFFLTVGVNPRVEKNQQETLLHKAVTKQRPIIAELALRAGVRLNALDAYKLSALHLAVTEPDNTLVKLLLGWKANPNVRGDRNRTPLYAAASAQKDEAVKLLLQAGADSTSKDEKNETPLHAAARKGHETTVALLLAHPNVPLDDQDDKGNTPLHYAAKNGFEDVVKILFDAGARTDIENNEHKTASMLAESKGHEDIAQFLQDAESDIQ
jgi:hypothetical protein